jgi:hypothetical protein
MFKIIEKRCSMAVFLCRYLDFESRRCYYKGKGTAVMVFGDYNWGGRRPWKKLLMTLMPIIFL